MHDAIIVGAGPAGSHMAWLLAREGLRVAIIDREAFPREKVCGGGLSRKAVDLLGVDLSPVVERRMTGAFISYRNHSTIVKDTLASPGCTVLRSAFDEFLLQRAVSAGARFFPRTTFVDLNVDSHGVTVMTNGDTLRGSWLIAADGVGSAVRNRVFGRNIVRYAPALEALVEVDPAALETYGRHALFDLGGMRRGYGWIFPKSDHLNVGVYSPFGAKGLRAELARFMGRYPVFSTPRSVRCQGYAIPVHNRQGQFARGRVWLVGDAAGLAEAVFGEGIYFALKSAALAAQAFLEAGREPVGEHYERVLRRELLPELRASRQLARLLYTFQGFAYSHLACHPKINDFFAGLITGETGYRECLRRTVMTLPQWLFHSSARHRTAGIHNT